MTVETDTGNSQGIQLHHLYPTQEGIVELVREDAAADRATLSPHHYLPHHAVICQDKDSTKVRIVYDASSKSVGHSLSDCLHVGPK